MLIFDSLITIGFTTIVQSNLELFLILLVLHLLSAAAGYTRYRFLTRTKLLGRELSPRHTLRGREYTKHLKLKIEKHY